jgi:formylglycine-generating enzyme required for sulfatase activity
LTPASTERAALSLPTFTPTIIPTILQLDATASSQPVGMISGNPAPAWILDNHLVPMAYIAAGPFEMGSDSGEANQKPVHRVDLEAFYIDRYEVTNSHYAECVAAGACEPPLDNQSKKRPNYYGNPSYADYPVIFITWQMATTYCDWRGGRLPTEAEWEKAARGGLEGSAYPWGNTAPICEAGKSNGANYDDDAKCNDIDTAAVGSYAPNGAGLYDMAGNVWEWVEDWYAAEYYRTSPQANPQGPDSGEYRVLRGGSFGSDKDHQQVSFRNYYDPLRRSYAFGFRCVRDVDALADFRPVDTPTPVAEAARTLEPTPTPGLKAAIAASSVNVRYGPGVDYPVIQYAYSGDEFVAVGRSADSSWLIVQIGDDLAGWIALSTVSFPYKVTVLPVLQAISAEKVKARLAGEDPAEISAGGSGSSGGGAYWWNIHP